MPSLTRDQAILWRLSEDIAALNAGRTKTYVKHVCYSCGKTVKRDG